MRKKNFHGNSKPFGNQRIMLEARYYFYKNPFSVSRFPFPAVSGATIRKTKFTVKTPERMRSPGREGEIPGSINAKPQNLILPSYGPIPAPFGVLSIRCIWENFFRHPNLDPASPASRIGVLQAEISFSNSLIYLSAFSWPGSELFNFFKSMYSIPESFWGIQGAFRLRCISMFLFQSRNRAPF